MCLSLNEVGGQLYVVFFSFSSMSSLRGFLSLVEMEDPFFVVIFLYSSFTKIFSCFSISSLRAVLSLVEVEDPYFVVSSFALLFPKIRDISLSFLRIAPRKFSAEKSVLFSSSSNISFEMSLVLQSSLCSVALRKRIVKMFLRSLL